ncbi:helix-turn-helix transcriptional regulator [Providencia stuartii]|uniref:helix-turn-helix transcriptional regulator n=1 Tax=Providencia stuartii TaxID=588 RepID=UPI00111D4AAF|nr:helix-turn-helix transcriptional regulator [Providencia stuartii]
MNNIKKYRMQAGMTRSDLAKKIGCSVGAVGHYELGRRTPPLNVCWEITSIFMQLNLCKALDEVFPPVNRLTDEQNTQHTDA